MNRPPIFFDIGDTLVFARRTLHEQVVRICDEAGHQVEEEIVRQTAHQLAQSMQRASTADLEAFEAWWRHLYARLLDELRFPGDTELASNELWSVWRSGKALRLFPETLPLLDRLRADGFPLGVISNWDDTFENVLGNLGLRDYFEVCVASYEVGVEKPDASIFQAALRKMGWNGNPPWYVGDRIDKDVAGAQAAGWKPILVDHFDHYTHLEPDGYRLVTNLLQVADIVQEDCS